MFTRRITLIRLSAGCVALTLFLLNANAEIAGSGHASIEGNGPAVNLIWMGGNDCPPCVHWRITELPKLRKSEEFKLVKFSYVTKVIRSAVPPKIFLPDEVKPFKGILDEAGNGVGGSPQAVVVVDGKVFDYWFGTRSAEDIERMLNSIRVSTAYPFNRCLRLNRQNPRKCDLVESP